MRNAWLFVLLSLGASLGHGAEVYPAKPVRVVAPFAPGGISDVVARVMSQQLSEQFGKTFIVDNRTGAGGVVGNGIVAKAAPDGHTLLMVTPAFTILPGISKSLQYDSVKDFTPITQIMRVPSVLVVSPALNVNTLKDFVALARANPGKFNYGSGGPGSALHLYSELFKIAAKVNIVHVPYKGGGENFAALIGGQIQMLIISVPTALQFVNSGRMRALAVTTEGKRAPSMPNVPSMSEAGVSGMTIYVWFGFAGPAGMPKAIVNELHAEVVKALAAPSVKDQFIRQDAEFVGSSPAEFSKLIHNELQLWAEVIKSAGITAR
ncbi:MAG: tripartite tricarboxylate transporter substrate binding protein [Betaproteobacteria bacterium]|nr:tripartite tricarboxylate transporter substrate binding protein [Betaproteobacteria bacterium]MBI2289115.1 tripartite tricarboxylate transporter substrate binding protein [Betaproteobacteria bacterium]MBI3053614.1 tripartite tricarboxylate transporter substrate binding protein [Betaproteobacteria bacterium]